MLNVFVKYYNCTIIKMVAEYEYCILFYFFNILQAKPLLLLSFCLVNQIFLGTSHMATIVKN